MARKARTKKDDKIIFLQDALDKNTVAFKEGPKRKNFTVHDLVSIKPITETQRQLFESWFAGSNIVASGSAGTGKTFISMFLALADILVKGRQSEIIIVRSAVSTRAIGFLPGSHEEKMEVYEAPYKDICADLLGKHDAYDTLKVNKQLRFMSTSFIRGLTWDNSIVIIDEIQNMSLEEIHTVMTRIGKNSRVIVCGDIGQNDLVNMRNEKSGISDFLRIAEQMRGFDTINFRREDVVRSGFVKDWLFAKEDLGL